MERDAASRERDKTAAGRQLFTDTGCDACHALADAEATGSVGPDLDEIAAAAAKYGKQQRQSPTEYVKTSITKPNTFVVPGFREGLMPETYSEQLSTAEIDTLVEYLLGVGKEKDAQ